MQTLNNLWVFKDISVRCVFWGVSDGFRVLREAWVGDKAPHFTGQNKPCLKPVSSAGILHG